MIKVVAFAELKWMGRKADYQIWNHLCRAFGAEFQLVYSYDEIEIPNGYTVVVMEEAGTDQLVDFIHPENCVYIFGRSNLNNMQNSIDHDHILKINYEGNNCLFGISAAGIVFYDRMLKQQSKVYNGTIKVDN